MQTFCQDRDLLAVEPMIYLLGHATCTTLATGGAATITNATFTAQEADFLAAAVEPGMVLVTSETTSPEGDAWEIVSVDSATTLTVSVLRADASDATIPPPDATDLTYFVRSAQAQIASASSSLADDLRCLAESAGIVSSDFVDSPQLCRATVFATLASLFRARADNARPHDANWIKADYYRAEFDRARLRLRLDTDADADGLAETTRTLGHVHLRRV